MVCAGGVCIPTVGLFPLFMIIFKRVWEMIIHGFRFVEGTGGGYVYESSGSISKPVYAAMGTDAPAATYPTTEMNTTYTAVVTPSGQLANAACCAPMTTLATSHYYPTPAALPLAAVHTTPVPATAVPTSAVSATAAPFNAVPANVMQTTALQAASMTANAVPVAAPVVQAASMTANAIPVAAPAVMTAPLGTSAVLATPAIAKPAIGTTTLGAPALVTPAVGVPAIAASGLVAMDSAAAIGFAGYRSADISSPAKSVVGVRPSALAGEYANTVACCAPVYPAVANAPVVYAAGPAIASIASANAVPSAMPIVSSVVSGAAPRTMALPAGAIVNGPVSPVMDAAYCSVDAAGRRTMACCHPCCCPCCCPCCGCCCNPCCPKVCAAKSKCSGAECPTTGRKDKYPAYSDDSAQRMIDAYRTAKVTYKSYPSAPYGATKYAPAAYAPAAYAPATYAPASYVPASYVPASYVPASYVPATYAATATAPATYDAARYEAPRYEAAKYEPASYEAPAYYPKPYGRESRITGEPAVAYGEPKYAGYKGDAYYGGAERAPGYIASAAVDSPQDTYPPRPYVATGPIAGAAVDIATPPQMARFMEAAARTAPQKVVCAYLGDDCGPSSRLEKMISVIAREEPHMKFCKASAKCCVTPIVSAPCVVCYAYDAYHHCWVEASRVDTYDAAKIHATIIKFAHEV